MLTNVLVDVAAGLDDFSEFESSVQEAIDNFLIKLIEHRGEII